jgi:acid stress-induced BolA-like protein IbaG/YrbA
VKEGQTKYLTIELDKEHFAIIMVCSSLAKQNSMHHDYFTYHQVNYKMKLICVTYSAYDVESSSKASQTV